MTGTSPAIGYVNVGVVDFPRALAFYRDTLGLALLFADEGFQYARFQAGTVPFAIAAGPDAAKGRAATIHTGIGFCVPDVDAAYRALAAKGVHVTMTPQKQPWGGYMAMFADPGGNIFYLDTPPR